MWHACRVAIRQVTLLQVTCGALLGMQNSLGDRSPCPLFISPTDAAEERAKWDVHLTDSPVGSILLSTFWAQSHVDAVSETRIEQESA